MTNNNLTSYLTQVQRLLHDASSNFWTTGELTDYINEARKRTVMDTGGYRVLQSIYSSIGWEAYPFGGVTGFNVTAGGSAYGVNSTVSIAAPTTGTTATAKPAFSSGVLTGITITNPGSGYTAAPAVTINPVGGGSGAAATAYYIDANTIDVVNATVYVGQTRNVLARKDWSTFNARGRAWVGYLGIPGAFAVYSYTTIYFAPLPQINYQFDIDSVVLPPTLVDGTTVEVLPYVFQDCPQYYAAYLAKVKEQSWSEADTFLQRYKQEIMGCARAAMTRALPYPYFHR